MRIPCKIKRVLLYATCVVAAVGVARFCHHATQGFRLSKVRANLIEQKTAALVSEKDQNFLNALFKQKFHFIGRGLQSFVFESEDGNYVLKLFNNRYQKKRAWFSRLSHFPFLSNWGKVGAAYCDAKLQKTFKSYEIAFEEMEDKTGLLYIHLHPTIELPSKLHILDPLNICHEIDPNTIGFLIQKRATLVYPALKKYLQMGEIEEAKQALSSLIHLFFWKWRQGIADNDPLIRTNYGFIGTEAIQIDVGPLSKQTVLQSHEEQKQQIEKITASLKCWLTENAPDLVPFLDQELLEQLSSKG